MTGAPSDDVGDKNEADEGKDFFSQVNRWIDLGTKVNQTILENAVDFLAKPDKRADICMSALESLSKSLVSGKSEHIDKLVDNQLSLMIKQIELTESLVSRLCGEKVKPIVTPSVSDRRFIDEAWETNPLFDYIKQSYLLNSKALETMVDCLDLSEDDRERVNYYTRQVSSAMSPTNFPATNPEVLRKTAETRGENLYKGISMLIEDQQKSAEFLNICMSDKQGMVVGENLAATPGKVVFENELMQLIQYNSATSHVRTVPMLFVPSWVNKYYIMDLREKNSMVKWLIEQGYTVYMISWINPTPQKCDFSFDDYAGLGLMTAIQQVKEQASVDQVHLAGYCLGGILVSAMVGYLEVIDDKSVATATSFASALDFKGSGGMSLLLDEITIARTNQIVKENGYLDGRTLSFGFCLLRENELYWNYYVQNYLKGERPSAYDILYWNTDSTNVCAPVHCFVAEDLYERNALIKPNAVQILGRPIDMRNVTTPMYLLTSEKDHIVKWESVFRSVSHLDSAPVKFVLAGSGHIAGVINPPSSNKYHYYINSEQPEKAEDWLDGAFKQDGSWWPDWQRWLLEYSGPVVDARVIDEACVVEDAPGRYVKCRLDEMKTTAAEEKAVVPVSRDIKAA